MRTSTIAGAVILLFLSFLPAPTSGQIYLTGILQDGVSASGNTAGSPILNTLGNELSFANLYVTQPNAGYAAPFLNFGNGAGTSIAYALTPGTYQFFFFSDPLADNNPGYYGLSLFFDGNNNTTPGIAAYSTVGVTSANAVPAGFSPCSMSGTPIPVPGTLTYSANGLAVTLTAYGFGMPGAFGVPPLDRVTNLNNSPDGMQDGVGVFELTVASVPEPSASVLLALGFASSAFLRRTMKR